MTDVTVPGRTGAATHSRRTPLASRLATLSRAVEGARRRPPVDVRRALLVAGSTAMALGFVAIVLGWYGAAHSAYQFQEIPYLISGGLLGVALVAGGGFLFFGAWTVRQIEESRRFAARVERTLDRVDRALELVATEAAAGASFPPHASNGADRGRAGDGGTPAPASPTAGGSPTPRGAAR